MNEDERKRTAANRLFNEYAAIHEKLRRKYHVTNNEIARAMGMGTEAADPKGKKFKEQSVQAIQKKINRIKAIDTDKLQEWGEAKKRNEAKTRADFFRLNPDFVARKHTKFWLEDGELHSKTWDD